MKQPTADDGSVFQEGGKRLSARFELKFNTKGWYGNLSRTEISVQYVVLAALVILNLQDMLKKARSHYATLSLSIVLRYIVLLVI